MSSFHPYNFFLLHSRQFVTPLITYLCLFVLLLSPVYRAGDWHRFPPPLIMCEGLVCPCVFVCKTAGPSGSGSKMCLATLASRTRGVLMAMESYWANEAPNLCYRSTSQWCFTEITEEESSVWPHASLWSVWHLILCNEPRAPESMMGDCVW